MQLTPSNALKTTILTDINNALNAGTGPAKIDIYTAPKPTGGPDSAITTQVLLGTLTCTDPAGVVASPGGIPTLTFNTITPDSAADNTGVAAWGRASSTGVATVPELDFDITTTGGGGFGQMNTTNIVAGGPITAPSIVITA